MSENENTMTAKEAAEFESPVPYKVHERDMARMERTIQRLWVALIVCIIGLICMFAYECQFIDEKWTFEANTDQGGTAVANGTGEVNVYGESKNDGEAENP